MGAVGFLEPGIQQHLGMGALWKACWLGQDHRGRGLWGRDGDPEVVETPCRLARGEEVPWFSFVFLQRIQSSTWIFLLTRLTEEGSQGSVEEGSRLGLMASRQIISMEA